MGGLESINTREPEIRYPVIIIKPAEEEIFPEGMGRVLVRGIRASVFLSCQWFIAPEPHDIRKTPTAINPPCMPTVPAYNAYPVSADKATESEIRTFPSSVRIFRKAFKSALL